MPSAMSRFPVHAERRSMASGHRRTTAVIRHGFIAGFSRPAGGSPISGLEEIGPPSEEGSSMTAASVRTVVGVMPVERIAARRTSSPGSKGEGDAYLRSRIAGVALPRLARDEDTDR